MYTMEDIQKVVEQIVEQFHPNKVILFGSYAYGEPTEDSDVDLMVIMPFEGKGHKQASKICHAIEYPFPMDLLARTPDTVEWRYKGRDPIIREVIDRGKILYERDQSHHPRVA
jgi:uncharacterized protein